MDSPEHVILDALNYPVLLLDADRRIAYANRAARDQFDLQNPKAPCYRVLRGNDEPCESCPLEHRSAGSPGVFRAALQGRICEVSGGRLERPVGNASYALSVTPLERGSRVDHEALRRMKHRFNNYLAPMAGKAEIILFALGKGNYEKAEKAANDILKYVEDSRSIEALFDLEPSQEETASTAY